MTFKKVSIIGLGYIGLPTAAFFSSKGIEVIGVDINQNTIDVINQGSIHIVEPGLEKLVRDSVHKKKLKAKLIPESSDAFLIAVPTPFKNNNHKIPEPDLSFVKTAVKSISGVIKQGDLIILESTSPVGTTELISKWLSELRPDLIFPHQKNKKCDINIAYCPERVLPGNIIQELQSNDRVIGGLTDNCSKKAIDLYKIFVNADFHVTNSRTAEMSKLTENTCRDVQIAFANELSIICEKENIDVWELINLANKHPRINILKPGPGVGGHCIAVDPWFIIEKNQNESTLMQAARTINDNKPSWVVDKVGKLINDFQKKNNVPLESINVACYGLAFKPNIDDIRQSPALEIYMQVKKNFSCNFVPVEPNIKTLKNEKLFSIDEAFQVANLHILLVAHDEFKEYNFPKKYTLDVCGLLSENAKI